MNGSMITRSGQTCAAFRAASAVLTVTILVLIAVASPLAAAPNLPPDLGECTNLAVDPGNKLVSHLYAEGVQVYTWNGTTWTFVGPEALLFADAGLHAAVGIHYAGPTWESRSGSKVRGSIVDRCLPDPDSIQWLLLDAASTEGPGIFHRITFIQRVNTSGGIAPTTPGDFPGQTVEVPYTTEYYFYRAH